MHVEDSAKNFEITVKKKWKHTRERYTELVIEAAAEHSLSLES